LPCQRHLPGLGRYAHVDELVGDAKHDYFESMAARLPSGRIAAPSDIAPAYLYVMESDFTTGETIHIDGGQRLI